MLFQRQQRVYWADPRSSRAMEILFVLHAVLLEPPARKLLVDSDSLGTPRLAEGELHHPGASLVETPHHREASSTLNPVAISAVSALPARRSASAIARRVRRAPSSPTSTAPPGAEARGGGQRPDQVRPLLPQPSDPLRGALARLLPDLIDRHRCRPP